MYCLPPAFGNFMEIYQSTRSTTSTPASVRTALAPSRVVPFILYLGYVLTLWFTETSHGSLEPVNHSAIRLLI